MVLLHPSVEEDPTGIGAPPAQELGLLVGINLLCLVVAAVREQHKWLPWLPEQGLTLVCGLTFGLLSRVVGASGSLEASDNFSGLFFEFFLPPIIFSSAYSLKRQDFFQNIGAILTLAVFGTISTMFLIGLGVYQAINSGLLTVAPGVEATDGTDVSLLHCMILGSILSAVDPVAVVAALRSTRVDRQLHSVLFGESVLNDAVAIVLYSGLNVLHRSSAGHTFGWPTAGRLLSRFFTVSVGSCALGASVGLGSSLVVRYAGLRHSPAKEQAMLLLFAYLSYLLARVSALSPVMSLFVTGIVMSHYTYYNLSQASQVGTRYSFRSIAHIMETFVFVFLGVSATTMDRNEWSTPLSLLLVALCLGARATSVAALCAVVNFSRCLICDDNLITLRAQCMLVWGGLRGAVAFALALHAPVFNHRGVLVSSTMFVVLFSFLVQGSSTQWLANKLRLVREGGYEAVDGESGTGTAISATSAGGRPDNERRRSGSSLRVLEAWRSLDEKVIKPVFGGRPRGMCNGDDGDNDDDGWVGEGREGESGYKGVVGLAEEVGPGGMPEIFNQTPRGARASTLPILPALSPSASSPQSRTYGTQFT